MKLKKRENILSRLQLLANKVLTGFITYIFSFFFSKQYLGKWKSMV